MEIKRSKLVLWTMFVAIGIIFGSAALIIKMANSP